MVNLFTKVLAVSIAALAACGDGDEVDEALAAMGKLTDRLCACTDLKCAEDVMKEWSRLKDPRRKPSKAEMEKAIKLVERMAACKKELTAVDAAPPPPLTPVPTPPAAVPSSSPPLSPRCDVAVANADRAFAAVAQAQAEARAAAIALDRACRAEAPPTDPLPAPQSTSPR